PDRSNKVNLNFFLWIVKVTVLVHLIFVIRGWLCSWQCIDTMEYAQLWLACALLFSFTYIPFTLYGRYRYFHSLVGMDQREGNQLTLKGEGKESLTLSPDQIIFIQSDDNYVDIFLAEESQPGRKIVFRCTLKSLESQLSAYPQFMRIHRSMLANVKYALNPFAHGRPKEIQLVFKDHKVALPISKSYLDSVESLFAHPK
ncbi:MAG: LytTR family DNA-binding domain-containing protein, partial [Cyclobacteriaceae bacterium]